jgi:CheY-like chemotaxis protein
MIEMLSSSLGPSCQLMTDLPGDLPFIHTDPNQLELALLNLALNARDAMPTGGWLSIAVRREAVPDPAFSDATPKAYVCVSVADIGLGMDEATLNRATEPFFTTKGVGKGTGLGLSMVDGLTAQSGGFMKITSRVGKGTIVELFFPEQERLDAKAPVEASAPASAKKHAYRILLVDDDDLVSDGVTGMLENLGHTVMGATSAEMALDVLASGVVVDCVITDYAMPGTTGLELANQLRRTRPDLPIILMTGYADAIDQGTIKIPLLAKPYRLETLSSLLDEVVGETIVLSVTTP